LKKWKKAYDITFMSVYPFVSVFLCIPHHLFLWGLWDHLFVCVVLDFFFFFLVFYSFCVVWKKNKRLVLSRCSCVWGYLAVCMRPLSSLGNGPFVWPLFFYAVHVILMERKRLVFPQNILSFYVSHDFFRAFKFSIYSTQVPETCLTLENSLYSYIICCITCIIEFQFLQSVTLLSDSSVSKPAQLECLRKTHHRHSDESCSAVRTNLLSRGAIGYQFRLPRIEAKSNIRPSIVRSSYRIR
jgi:hypothetical protein